MAALTTATPRRYRPWGMSVTQNWRVANTNTIYVGAWTALPGTGGLTSNRGYLVPYQNIATIEWAGMAIPGGTPGDLSTTNTIVGNTSAAPVVEATTEAGPFIFERATVTGVSAQTDVGKAFYASNDNDLTLTAAVSPAVGRIIYWYSSTTADVLFYGYLAAIVI